MRLAPLVLLLALAPVAQAQTPGSCALGEATAVLDANDVRATVFNTGALFFGHTGQALYEVPRGSGLSPLFATGLWVGGRVNGELRVAGALYQNFEFWPGPLNPTNGRPPDPADCSAYDRIWTVSRTDVARYLATGEATADLAEWPHHLGAPVLDGDGDPTNYDLAAGDQPAISGAQTAFWVMNDVGNVHESTGTPPIGLEVRVEAFAAGDSTRTPQEVTPFSATTFYRFHLVNRSAHPLDSAYASLYVDPDLGNASDDYVGSDTLRQMGYVYNADDFDESATGYGSAPPAVGYTLLDTPVGAPNGRDDDHDGEVDEAGEPLGMSALSCSAKNGPYPYREPQDGIEMYRCMQGLWPDGSPIRAHGFGGGTEGPITTYLHPGDPVQGTFWTEGNTGGGPNPPGDRRFVIATGPFRLPPGEAQTITAAIVYARGSTNLTSVTLLRPYVSTVRDLYEEGTLDPTRVTADEWVEAPPPGGPPPDGLTLRAPRPNPFAGTTTVGYEVPAPMRVRLSLHDVLGREVAAITEGLVEAGAYEVAIGAGLPAGTYLLRFAAGNAVRAVVVTKRR